MNKIAVTSHSRILQIYIRDEADQSVAAEIFKEHEYRIAEKVIREATEPLIDIGAHSGLFALYARSINPIVKIVAVEPEPRNLELLRKHILENDIKNIEVIDEAIAGQTGRRKLLISSDSHNHKLLSAAEKSSENTIMVSALALADLLKKCIISSVALIKMDIEGGEHEIFETISPEDLGKVGAWILEYHNYDQNSHKTIETKLRENGYSVQIFPSRFDKKMGFIFALNKRS